MEGKKIVIIGNIGVGKTELARSICISRNLKLYEEPTIKNPYFADFLKNKKKVAFEMELYLLKVRVEGMCGDYDVADRSIEEDMIFAKTLFEDNDMTLEEFTYYEKEFEKELKLLRKPDMYIYLKNSVSKTFANIAKRGIAGEETYEESYLKNLDDKYDWLIDKYIGVDNVIEFCWEEFGDTEDVLLILDIFFK